MKAKGKIMGSLAAVMAGSLLLSACGSSETKSPSATSAGNGGNEGGFGKQMKITAYHSAAYHPEVPMPAREEDPIRQMMEKAVNVDFNMIIPPADQKVTKLNTMIASGDIPDMIFMPDRGTAVQYYEQGILADLDSYIKDYPALQSRFKPEEWEAMKYKGKTIGTPGYEFVNGISSWWIRNDWLTKLGLKAPTNPDELLTVMKAFTFNDPDGNGKNDTYGFVAGIGKDGNLSGAWGMIFWMFGVNPNVVDMVNGKLTFDNTDSRMQEALAYIKTMLDAKVVDPDWVTINDGTANDKKMYSGKVGILINDWRRMETNTQQAMKEVSGEIPDWIVFPPVKGPHGDQTVGLKSFQNNSWAISKTAAKDPEKVKRILALLQYWYTDKDFYPWANYGIKGIHWDLADGKIQRLTDNLNNRELMNKYIWTSNYALSRRADDALYFNFTNPKTSDFHKINLQYIRPNPVNPFVMPDPNDTLYSDRIKYVNESLLKFMMGKEPLSNWDNYVKTLETKFEYTKYKEYAAKQLKDAGLLK
ncbi:extracellular solute-binding protein [Paenibacillus aurantius]|uniref:Extracellular solute-binding protein n=1 Tax=Paenibacillus aurantius TaxID=2918900 RepID=A0AA96RHX2_9BACL|nr:extracellular solute-binding protein [Paenibacillus aurantius]WNQ14006.1 extracellular solute-binding protein [Paenibacillus aurantius]